MNGFCSHNDLEKKQFVWDVTPRPSQEAIEKAHFARPHSHNDEEFVMRTDAAFKQDPSRYFSLYCVKADKMGGGRSKFVHGERIVKKLQQMRGGRRNFAKTKTSYLGRENSSRIYEKRDGYPSIE